MEYDLRIHIRTYPRSGTHIIGTLLHYRYGFCPITPTMVKPIPKGFDKPLQFMTFHYNQHLEGFPDQTPEIFILRNPINCIGSQYFRNTNWNPRNVGGEDLNTVDVTGLDMEHFVTDKKPDSYIRPAFHSSTVWNECGKYNEMLTHIKDDNLVLYFEDLFTDPQVWFNDLDSYFKNKYDLDPINTEMTMKEIMDLTLEWYNKGHRALNTWGEFQQVQVKYLKNLINPYVNKFIDFSNVHMKRYE
jgi:hypothetical protein